MHIGKGRSSVVFALLLASLLLSVARGEPDEGFLLAKGQAGQVRLGMSVDEVYAQVGRDHTNLVDLFKEGSFDPALEVYLNGSKDGEPSLVAEIGGREGCDRISRIAVADRRFRTMKGIGVGSTLGSIRRNYQVDWIDFGEGRLYARVSQIGMSFELDYWPTASWTTLPHRGGRVDIPDSAKVVSVLVVE